METTPAERTIANIREQASTLEQKRRKAYEARLSELVIEIAEWNQPLEVYPMVLAEHAFRLGFQCGSNKMYEYL